MKKIILLFILPASMFMFTQCSKRTVSMSVMQPAQITFPTYVNTLLLVDRTKMDKNLLNVVEAILTGELPGEDRAGVQAVMSSLQSTLMSSPRFHVKTASETFFGNSLTSAFPDPLPWHTIENLCAQYGTEAIVAVEIYDTDFIVTNGQRTVKKKVTEDGVETEKDVVEFFAEGVGSVKIGIRLYDPKAKSIVDQQLFRNSRTWKSTGSSIQEAIVKLVAKQEAARQVSMQAAVNYAHKISPMPVRVSREFYSKSRKSPPLTSGARQADVNDWSGAIQTWESGLKRARDKEAGKMAYNIAIAHEVLGNLDLAVYWAGKAWVDYGNKKGRSYASLLNSRIRQQEVVEQQMN